MEDVKDVEEAEDVEESDSASAESRLARKLASLGMAAGRYYTPGRMQGEQQFHPGRLGFGQTIPDFHPHDTTTLFPPTADRITASCRLKGASSRAHKLVTSL